MLPNSLTFMRPRDNPQTSVFACRVINSHPDRTGCQRPHCPVLAVLMPGGTGAHPGRFSEKTRIPQRKIVAKHLSNHVQNSLIASEFQKIGLQREQGRAVIRKRRIALDKPAVRRTNSGQGGLAQPKIRYHETGLVVLRQLRVGKERTVQERIGTRRL